MQEASTGMEGARQDALCHGMLSELLSLDAPGLSYFHASMSLKVLAEWPHV